MFLCAPCLNIEQQEARTRASTLFSSLENDMDERVKNAYEAKRALSMCKINFARKIAVEIPETVSLGVPPSSSGRVDLTPARRALETIENGSFPIMITPLLQGRAQQLQRHISHSLFYQSRIAPMRETFVEAFKYGFVHSRALMYHRPDLYQTAAENGNLLPGTVGIGRSMNDNFSICFGEVLAPSANVRTNRVTVAQEYATFASENYSYVDRLDGLECSFSASPRRYVDINLPVNFEFNYGPYDTAYIGCLYGLAIATIVSILSTNEESLTCAELVDTLPLESRSRNEPLLRECFARLNQEEGMQLGSLQPQETVTSPSLNHQGLPPGSQTAASSSPSPLADVSSSTPEPAPAVQQPGTSTTTLSLDEGTGWYTME